MSLARKAVGGRVALAVLVAGCCLQSASGQQIASASELTLEDAVLLALKHNERARAADQRTLAARARVAKARAFFLPDITLEASYTRLARGSLSVSESFEVRRDFDALGARVALDVVLFNGRGFPLYDQAQLEAEATELDSKEQKRRLAFDAALLFVASIGQEQVRVAAERRVALAQKSVREAEARLAAGLASSNDVTQVELELSAAERTLLETLAQAESTRLDLRYVVGDTLGARVLAVPTRLLDTALATAPESSQALRRETRLDLQALHKRKLALAASAREPLWRWVPSLSLTAEGHAAAELRENPDGSIGVKLSWALWDGGERSADREERLALLQVSELELVQKSRQSQIEVEKAWVTLRRGQRTIETAERAAETARKNSRETAELYRQGLTTALQVADASERLFQAEVDLTRARYDMALGLLDLRAARGLDPFGKEPR